MLLVVSIRSVGRHPYVVPAKLRGYQGPPTIDTAYTGYKRAVTASDRCLPGEWAAQEVMVQDETSTVLAWDVVESV
jgi:hypothetical protein